MIERQPEEERIEIDTTALDELQQKGSTPLEKVKARLKKEEDELGVEYVGRDKGQSRAQRRENARILKRVTKRPVATLTLRHPLLGTLTPHGAKVLKKRRAAAKRAKQARKISRRAR